MKRLLSIVAIGALLSSGVSANSFSASATIPPKTQVAIVGTGTTGADALSGLADNLAELKTGTALALGIKGTGTATEDTFPVHLSTNVYTKVEISLTSSGMTSTNPAGTTAKVPTQYKYTPTAGFDGAVGAYQSVDTSVAGGTALDLTILGTNDPISNTKVGDITIKTSPTNIQQAGIYTETIEVAVTAPI